MILSRLYPRSSRVDGKDLDEEYNEGESDREDYQFKGTKNLGDDDG
jgi:hypothetical protein